MENLIKILKKGLASVHIFVHFFYSVVSWNWSQSVSIQVHLCIAWACFLKVLLQKSRQQSIY